MGTQSLRPLTMEAAVKTARNGTAARPLTNANGRNQRLSTSSVVDTKMKHPAVLEDPEKCVTKPALARARFLYLFHVENDTARAQELATAAIQSQKGTFNAKYPTWDANPVWSISCIDRACACLYHTSRSGGENVIGNLCQ